MNHADLAARFGTPAYVYDLAKVRAAYADLCAVLPEPAGLYYSLKANPHPLLVSQLAQLGCQAEVCAEGEIRAALTAGVDPRFMLLTGPGKTAELIGSALSHGVRRFSVDSPTDIGRVGEVARRLGVQVECLVRVNADQAVPGMGLAMTGTASQFGADASWVAAAPELFHGGGPVRIVGLHLYMGTNLIEEETLVRQFDTAAALAAKLGPALGDLLEVDLGGGFGAPYARAGVRPTWGTLGARLAPVLDQHLPGWRSGAPRITFESGRYLVGDCGFLLCRVLDVKVSKSQVFAVLDSGINHLGGMAGLRRLPPILPTVDPVPASNPGERKFIAATADEDRVVPTTIVGPLCTPLDTFVRAAALPVLAPGRLVVVPNVGAYGLTASLLAFLGHPTPAEVVIDGDEVLGVSRLEIVRTERRCDERTV